MQAVDAEREHLCARCGATRSTDTPKCPNCGDEGFYVVKKDAPWASLSTLGKLRRCALFAFFVAILAVGAMIVIGLLLRLSHWGLGWWRAGP